MNFLSRLIVLIAFFVWGYTIGWGSGDRSRLPPVAWDQIPSASALFVNESVVGSSLLNKLSVQSGYKGMYLRLQFEFQLHCDLKLARIKKETMSSFHPFSYKQYCKINGQNDFK